MLILTQLTHPVEGEEIKHPCDVYNLVIHDMWTPCQVDFHVILAMWTPFHVDFHVIHVMCMDSISCKLPCHPCHMYSISCGLPCHPCHVESVSCGFKWYVLEAEQLSEARSHQNHSKLTCINISTDIISHFRRNWLTKLIEIYIRIYPNIKFGYSTSTKGFHLEGCSTLFRRMFQW